VMFAALSLNNIAVFGFHFLVSRALGPARYGALGAVLALTLLLNVVAGALSVAVVREVVLAPPGVISTRDVGRVVLGLSAVVAAAGLAGSPLVSRFLHFKTDGPVVWLVVYFAVVLLGVVPRGVLIGQRRFVAAGSSVGVGAALRIALGLTLARQAGVSGALAGYAIAEAVSTLLAAVLTRHGEVATARLVLPWRPLMLSIAGTSGMWIMTGSDGFLARHLLGAVPAGYYVAASTAGSIALWASYNITTSAFPSLVAAAATGGDAKPFWRGLVGVVGLATAVAGLLMLLSVRVTAVMFGSGYRPTATILVLLAVSNGAQGVAFFLVHHQLASRRWTAMLPWAGLTCEVIGIYLWHGSSRSVAAVAIATAAALVVALGLGSAEIVRRGPGHAALDGRVPVDIAGMERTMDGNGPADPSGTTPGQPSRRQTARKT